MSSGQPKVANRSGQRPSIPRKWRWAILAVILAALALLFPDLRSGLADLGTRLVSQSAENGTAPAVASLPPAELHSTSRPNASEENGRARQVRSSKPAPDSPDNDVSSQVEDNELAGSDSNGAGADSPPEPGAADPAPKRSISGSVIDDAGVPLPGREIVATPAVDNDSTPSSKATRTLSDSRGMFEFAELYSGEYILHVAESVTHQSGSLRARAGADAADIHLQRKGEIVVVGTVLDDLGTPLANAGIRAHGSGSRATTDDSGRFQITIDRQKVSGQPVLDFSLLGYRTLRERVPDPPNVGDNTVELEITLESLDELITFIGSVQDSSGEPVAGARVTLSSLSSSFNANVSTGQFGEFNIEAVEAGDLYRLAVDPRSTEYRRFTSDPLVIDRANNAYDVQLEDGGQASLAGTLVDPAGDPLPYFMLWVRNTEQRDTAPIPVETDAAGRFAPLLLSAGPIQLESRSSPRLEASGIVLSPGESLDVRVPVDWGNDWLLGRVIDADGRPIAQARVSVHWSSQFAEGRSISSRQTRTDAAGFFGFSNLGASQYRLTCVAPGFKTRQLNPALDTGSELEIRLERVDTGG